MELYETDTAYERVIHYDEYNEKQIRLTVNVFRGIEYLHIREYYLSFDEEWCATPKGCAMPLDLHNTKQLFIGLAELLADAEVDSVIQAILGDSYEIRKKESSN